MTKPKYNRLQTRAHRHAMHGTGIEDEARMSGRTTATAFIYIGLCIQKPNEWHEIRDHHGSAAADRNLRTRIADLAKANELKFFEFDERNRVRCRLFTDNPWEIA